MLVLARHEGESVMMFDGIVEVKVLSITGKIVRLGFEAPREVTIERKEKFLQAEEGCTDGRNPRRP
jgi:carbon storage regulator